VIFEDSAHPITPGRRCTAITPNRVSCEVGFGFVIARLEDGDDEATTEGTFGREPQGGFLIIDGQQGADTIRAESGRGNIDGGTGTDRLIGGPLTQSIDAVDLVRRGEFSEMPDHRRERDEVTCAPAAPGEFVLPLRVDANDVVSGPCPQRNVFLEEFVLIEGTEGADNLSPAGEPSRVFGFGGDDSILSTDLDDRADGGAGADRLGGGGLLLGGTGEDQLDAGARSNWPGRPRLDGQSGDDRLLGSAVSDSLAGGTGADVISGRDGSDLIRSRDGVRDRVVCGSGRDRVSADRRDSVARDCEVVSRG
jgi:Ca2+-binding RTX toxin-like protein